MFLAPTITYALLGGILPALIWLYVILREDRRCPEPKPMIALAFFAGALSVLVSVPLERLSLAWLPGGVPVFLAWAMIEEIAKYALAALLVLWRRSVDEPIDLIIYMITAALGFAAVENALFLLQPLAGGNILESLLTGNLRFIGSTLLHVVASSAVGFMLALSFRRRRSARVAAAIGGLVLAIALHALFNVLIIDGSGQSTLYAFLLVWGAAVVGFALFEILRYVRYRRLPPATCDI
jgi:RsiW-degrading membrane proteinase PrsW (M82 family)